MNNKNLKEAYGWANDYWHDIAVKEEIQKEFLEWIMQNDARLQSAYDYYMGYSDDALHDLVVDYLDENFKPVEDYYKTFEGEGEFGVREKGTNKLLFSSENSDEVDEYIDDNLLNWSDETYDIWYDAAKKAINEFGFYNFMDDEELEEELKRDGLITEGSDKYYVAGYFDEKMRGLDDNFMTNDRDLAMDKAWEFANNGDYTVIKNTENGSSQVINVDDATDDVSEYLNDMFNLIESTKIQESQYLPINSIYDFLESWGGLEEPEKVVVYYDDVLNRYTINLAELITWKDFRILQKSFIRKYFLYDIYPIVDSDDGVTSIGISLGTSSHDDLESLGFELSENKTIKEESQYELSDFDKLKSLMYTVEKYLSDNNIYFNEEDFSDTSSTISFYIHMGDWKHEHIRLKNAVLDFLSDNGVNVITTYSDEEDNGSDTYDATHYFMVDVDSIPLDLIKNDMKESNDIDMKTNSIKEAKNEMSSSIKTWYMREFPSDEEGKYLNDITFADVFDALKSHQDIYDVMGGGDSVIRERIFSKLSKIIGKDYNYIYDMWLSEDLKESKMITESNNKVTFKAFITNLGLYNEGELVGEWVEFPIDEDEFEQVLDRIGINDEYEEWFVTDYECDLPGFDWQDLGEYVSYDTLQEYGELLDRIDDDEAVRNVYEVTGDLQEAIDGLESGEYIFYPGIDSDYDLGEYIIDEIYGNSIPEDLVERYFDYEALGRDLGFDDYETEDEDGETVYLSAGEYWCGDENASDYEIGEECVAQLGIEGVGNKEYYFDYEQFGRDLTFENFTLTTGGAVEST